jgi:hypothetical protein
VSEIGALPKVEDAPFSRASFFRASAIVIAIAGALAGGCLYLLLDQTVPRTTAVVIGAIALLPIAFLLYLGFGVAFWAATDRRPPGTRAAAWLAAVLQRRV